jgi:hypothetical protein
MSFWEKSVNGSDDACATCILHFDQRRVVDSPESSRTRQFGVAPSGAQAALSIPTQRLRAGLNTSVPPALVYCHTRYVNS